MKSFTGEELLRILFKLGWKTKRIKGSHHILLNEKIKDTILSVPVHKGKTLPLGTQRSLIKDAGYTIEEFEIIISEI